MNYMKLITVSSILLMMSACSFTRPYEPPKDNQPAALLKMKYRYSEVVDDATLGVRMTVRHDAKSDKDPFLSAFNKSFGTVSSKGKQLQIPMDAVKIHPGKKTDINMAVYFYWYTTQSYMVMINNAPQMQTRQVYNERACTTNLSFTPEAGKVYMLDYNSPTVDRDCRSSAYEQVKRSGGKFKLTKVAASK